MLLKPVDFGITIPLLGVVIASFFWVYGEPAGRSLLKLKGENGEWVFPVDADETIAVSGPLGDTVVTIHGGQACVVSSPCIHKSCVAAGSVRFPGQWAACLPNRVMVYIEKGAVTTEDETDAASW